MKSSVLLFHLLLLLKIILQTECRNLETTSESSTSNVSDTDTELFVYTIDNINDTELNNTKDEGNSTIDLGESFGLIIGTRSKRESSTMNTVNSTESKLDENVKADKDVNQTSARLEETIPEIFLEPWSRVRRGADDGECTDEDQKSSGSNSEEDSQNESSNQVQSDYDDTDEDNDPSNESSKQVDPEGLSSMNEEVREERDVGESGETLEEGTISPSLHQVNPSKNN